MGSSGTKQLSIDFFYVIMIPLMGMYVCIGLWTRIACPNHDMVVFQPHTAAIPDIDLVSL